ncbi:hypothetical protein ES703_87426 [subsurface metagenome]
MIKETIVLLTPFEDCSKHRLAKHIGYLVLPVLFNDCFYEPLQKIFSKVIVYDCLKRMVEIGVGGMNQEVIELVGQKQPKYVLWAAFGEYYEITESTFEAIRKEGAQVVGWFFDDEVRFDYYSKWLVPYIDYLVTNDSETVPKYKELGAWVTHGIPDTGSAVQRDWSKVNEKYDVSFVGSMRADRRHYIKALKDRNIPVILFGEQWGRFVSYEEMKDIFATSKINLNFSKTYKYMKSGIKGRIFKVCLAGGFLLTEYAPGIGKYYEIGKEIVCFQNSEEMIDKIVYYLNHDEERRAIAQAGWRRASSEHTSFHVVSRVFGEIETASSQGQKSNPEEIRMPTRIRRRVADYYFSWGRAFLVENCKGLWGDALTLSMSYYPRHIRARLCYIIGLSPPFIRPFLTKVYVAQEKLQPAILSWLARVPYLRKIKRSLTTRWLRTSDQHNHN